MERQAKIFVAGHRGMVGSAIVRKLHHEGYSNLLLKSSQELDLRNQADVADLFAGEKPEYVFLVAGKVGGILANNTFRAEFIYDNLMIEANVIHQSYLQGVRKLIFLGSSCIYPKMAEQPLEEEFLLSGYLEATNEPYAIAKIAGIKLCESYRRQYGCNFISAMPTNLYGSNDNYDLQNSHVIPALIRRFLVAKKENAGEIELWGTGTALREFMHVDDLADACIFLMQYYNEELFLNVGSGEEVSICELAELIGEIVGFTGKIVWDRSKPDGTPRKLLNTSKLQRLGWKCRIKLREGLKKVIENQ